MLQGACSVSPRLDDDSNDPLIVSNGEAEPKIRLIKRKVLKIRLADDAEEYRWPGEFSEILETNRRTVRVRDRTGTEHCTETRPLRECLCIGTTRVVSAP